MVRKASARKRQKKMADKKKLVAGLDFAPPEPIASVLIRGSRRRGIAVGGDMTHEDQVALEILSERAVESARRGTGRRAVASPHRRDESGAAHVSAPVMPLSRV